MLHKKVLRITMIITIALLVMTLVYASENHYKEKLIKADIGGIITAGDGAPGTKLDIPAGALSADTIISMDVSSDSVAETQFNFGPHGTVFNQPVELQLSWQTLNNLQDLSSQDLVLYYYDESLGQWLEETTAVWDDNGKKATVYIDHFSYYYYGRR
jgi:hypothetical protein